MTVRVFRGTTERNVRGVYDVEIRDGLLILYTCGENLEDDGAEMYRLWDGWDYEIEAYEQYAY